MRLRKSGDIDNDNVIYPPMYYGAHKTARSFTREVPAENANNMPTIASWYEPREHPQKAVTEQGTSRTKPKQWSNMAGNIKAQGQQLLLVAPRASRNADGLYKIIPTQSP